MGVAGLWDVIRSTAEARSLTHLAVVDGFEANPSGRRGYRIGIDASIWFFHAAYGREGENPELRTLFFRCARLMAMPLLPVFVFDGPKRPSVKRGKRVNGSAHWLVSGMKEIIQAFGFEWRTAPGEAEAELAYLNKIGVIDAVLSDDVDNFLFGAQTVVRNPSNSLSGNKSNPIKNSAGRDDGQHVMIYRAQKILEDPKIQLTQGGFILIGLLSGGDYDDGVMRCGPSIAHGLARCGFGDELFHAAKTMDQQDLQAYLVGWRERLREELRMNSRGLIGRKCVALSKSIPDTFPNPEVLLAYAKPITSLSEGKGVKDLRIKWDQEPNLMMLAALCERKFEWGYKSRIIKRFKTVIWQGAVQRILRRAVMDLDLAQAVPHPTQTPRKQGKGQPSTSPCGTPSRMITKYFSSLQLDSPNGVDDDEDRVILKIHSTRTHASTDGLLEYRLEIDPTHLVHITEEGIQGIRADDDDGHDSGWDSDTDGDGKKTTKKGEPKESHDPHQHLRLWMPASMVRIAEPGLADEWEQGQLRKAEKKAGKGGKKTTSSAVGNTPPVREATAKKQPRKKQTPDHQAEEPINDVRRNLTAAFVAQNPSQDARRPLETSSAQSSISQPHKVKRKPPPIPHRLYESSDDEEENIEPPLTFSFNSSPLLGVEGAVSRSVAGAAPSTTKPSTRITLIPRPFPMSAADMRPSPSIRVEDVFESSSGPSSTSSTPSKRRQAVSSPSDSENPLSSIKKSPCKRAKHGSLGTRDAHCRSDEELLRRPVAHHTSPKRSVKHPLLTHSIRQPAIIEISSDSDSNQPEKLMPPLLVARAKAQDRRAATDTATTRMATKHVHHTMLDCVDLT